MCAHGDTFARGNQALTCPIDNWEALLTEAEVKNLNAYKTILDDKFAKRGIHQLPMSACAVLCQNPVFQCVHSRIPHDSRHCM